MKLEYALAAVFAVWGVVTVWRSLGESFEEDVVGARVLLAVHDAARALFWFGLAAFFVAYGVVAEPQGVRWMALIPIAMAALRLVAAAFLARSEKSPPDR
ncbi:MAG: hypothetical protein ACRDJP_02130 [Actinomycetota bacterium]